MSEASPSPSPLLSSASSEALEWPRFLRLLSALAETPFGARRVERLAPAPTWSGLLARRAAFEETGRLLLDGPLVPGLGDGVELLVPRLLSDHPPLVGTDVLQLGSLLRVAAAASDRVQAADPPCDELAGLASGLPDPSDWIRRIERTLDRRGTVRDDASPLLGVLRRRIQGSRDQLYGELSAIRERFRDELSEETVPMRGGRLMLMLQAGAKGRLPGLVHGRSGTGRSFYFEPLEVVEANNTLQSAVEEDEAERARLFAELLDELRAAAPEIERLAGFLGLLDLLQACHRFAGMTGARLAELADDGVLRLRAARHPLLDPRLAELRERVLGSAGHRGEAVALELELGGSRRALVVTGPNAGGKTVALKTSGLLAVATLAGLPIPAAAGSAVPRFTRIVAAVGDEQEMLADRSTFSGRLLRLAEVWEARGADALLLVDELGSGTDPEEGAALAVSLLEGLLESDALSVITTHLTRLAAAALELPGAGCAAMEFDPASGRPTYRLLPGPPGGSEALALARRLGLPSAWLDRAEHLLGPEHRDLRRLLGEIERTRQELTAATESARREARAAESERARLAAELAAAVAERRELALGLRRDLERFRRETVAKLGAEVEQMRAAWEEGRRRGLAERSVERLFAEAPRLEVDDEPVGGDLRVGDRVRHRALGWNGRLERLVGDEAEVAVGGKRLRCSVAELAAQAGGGGVSAPATRSPRAPQPDLQTQETAAELKLIGERVEPALDAVDEYLDRAVRSNLPQVRIVHGHGSGRLRQAIREHLRAHPLVATQRPGAPNEGGNGATVVTLRG